MHSHVLLCSMGHYSIFKRLHCDRARDLDTVQTNKTQALQGAVLNSTTVVTYRTESCLITSCGQFVIFIFLMLGKSSSSCVRNSVVLSKKSLSDDTK